MATAKSWRVEDRSERIGVGDGEEDAVEEASPLALLASSSSITAGGAGIGNTVESAGRDAYGY
jgi:hypothetical protein